MASLDDLLTVQDLDTRIDQLRYQRAHLPQFSELASVRAASATARRTADEIAARLHELRSAQKEAEDHASLIEDKSVEVQGALYGGSVVSHKELEALQEEHASLKVRQGQFEDQALELMEQAEPVEGELAEQRGVVDALDADITRLESEVLVAQAEIDVQLDTTQAERTAASAGVPAEMLSSYDELRSQLGGIAVARLSGARCEGCHLEIPSAQLDAVRRAPVDALVTCPECSRILVR